MNSVDFHEEKSSLQLLGKEFIIVVVVVFSALSFTLGYFVGKSGIDQKPQPPVETSGITPEPVTLGPQTPPDMPLDENTPQIEETEKDVVQPQPKEPFVVVESKQPEPAEETSLKPVRDSAVSAQGRKSDGPLYAIQLAAFKSSSEAEALRKKYSKKGYTAYVTTSNGKDGKIYKVKTGQFGDRKKAEVISLKLNKTEKLKTFITLKNE